MMSRISVCIALLMCLVTAPTARTQEAREPAKPQVKKPEGVKPIDRSAKKKVQDAVQHNEPTKPHASLTRPKSTLNTEFENPNKKVHLPEADKKESTKHVTEKDDESGDEHHHHSDAGCDKFKDLAAKKKCEDGEARHTPPVKKN